MNWNEIQSNWAELKYSIFQNWEKITIEQLEFIAGRRDYLVRKIQNAYGVTKEEADNQLSDWQAVQINIDGHFYESKPFFIQQYL